MNALANEALPIFLDKLVPSYIAVILSVTLVLFFGEIIPSAIFTGPSQLSISSKLAPLVRCVLFLLAPIAWPIAKLLDHFLHEEGSLEKYDRVELSALVRLQYEARKTAKRMRKEERTHMSIREPLSTSLSNDLDRPSEMSHRYVGHIDEVNMVEGALQMHTRKVVDVMQPWKKVYAIPSDMILNEMNILDIYTKGYSRIPVYKKGNGEKDERKQICGLFKSRQLAVISAQEQRPLSTIPLAIPFCVTPSMNMVDLLNILQSGGGHMAIVCLKPAIAEDALSNGKTIPPNAYVVGIVTLEDCIEELIQEEIFDEYDKEERITHNRTKWVIKKWKTFVQKKKTMREAAAAAADVDADESTKLLV
jgi:metal transporter CNNM